MLTKMDENSWVLFKEKVMQPSEEELTELKNAMPQVRDTWKFMGKQGELPRIQKLFGSFPYTYSSHKLTPEPCLPALVDRCLKYAAEQYPDFSWNGALVNLYVDGSDCVGMHHDDEPDLNPDAPILSFSFGATRRFRIAANKNHTHAKLKSMNIDLKHDDLVVMGGILQDGFKHGVPKTARKVSWRMNITIRSFVEKNKKCKVGS